VAYRTDLAGQTHLYLKGINYVENTSGQWIQVTGGGADYGFVDTGLQSSSSWSGIAMYGSW
jgi:hypothetical protein